MLMLFLSIGAMAQTYDALPVGSKPYGNQLYLTPTGLIVSGTGSAKFRVLGTKQYVDSVLTYYATKTGIETLTNKTLTAPVINNPDINSGTANSLTMVNGSINNAPIGNTIASTVRGTTITATIDVILPSATPSNGLSAAPVAYVQNAINGLSWKQQVDIATTGNITLSGSQTVDGISSGNSKRALVKNQNNPAENGVYITSSSGAWTRTADANTADNLSKLTVLVGGGLSQQYTVWTSASSVTTVGIDPVNLVQSAGPGSYLSGQNMKLDGNVFSTVDAPVFETQPVSDNSNKAATTYYVGSKLATGQTIGANTSGNAATATRADSWNGHNITSGTPSSGNFIIYNGTNFITKDVLATSPLNWNASTSSMSLDIAATKTALGVSTSPTGGTIVARDASGNVNANVLNAAGAILTSPNIAPGTANLNAASPLSVTGGRGGNNTATTGFVQAGSGADIAITAGAGGDVSGVSGSGFSGNGGNLVFKGGAGGNTSGTGSLFGGSGGGVDFRGGNAYGLGGFASLIGGDSFKSLTAGGNVYIGGGLGNNSGTSQSAYDGSVFLGYNLKNSTRVGNVVVGTDIDDRANRFQVLGNTKLSGNLEFTGLFKNANGSYGIGKVLTSDENGVGSWQSPTIPTWGSITGSISSQTDLYGWLNLKGSLNQSNTWSQPQTFSGGVTATVPGNPISGMYIDGSIISSSSSGDNSVGLFDASRLSFFKVYSPGVQNNLNLFARDRSTTRGQWFIDATGDIPVVSDIAPASATASGTKGEIRITPDYIYICVNTDQWVRAATSTW